MVKKVRPRRPAEGQGAMAVAENLGESESHEAGPLDREHLARQTLGDVDLQREILALFRRQSGVILARLMAARGSDERRMAAHTLKGSARAIGAWRVAAAAEAVEAATLGPDLAPLAGALGEANARIETILAA
jgi:HPt (histidine-containing phosphotransfer) domain-containing protein